MREGICQGSQLQTRATESHFGIKMDVRHGEGLEKAGHATALVAQRAPLSEKQDPCPHCSALPGAAVCLERKGWGERRAVYEAEVGTQRGQGTTDRGEEL